MVQARVSLKVVAGELVQPVSIRIIPKTQPMTAAQWLQLVSAQSLYGAFRPRGWPPTRQHQRSVGNLAAIMWHTHTDCHPRPSVALLKDAPSPAQQQRHHQHNGIHIYFHQQFHVHCKGGRADFGSVLHFQQLSNSYIDQYPDLEHPDHNTQWCLPHLFQCVISAAILRRDLCEPGSLFR